MNLPHTLKNGWTGIWYIVTILSVNSLQAFSLSGRDKAEEQNRANQCLSMGSMQFLLAWTLQMQHTHTRTGLCIFKCLNDRKDCFQGQCMHLISISEVFNIVFCLLHYSNYFHHRAHSFFIKAVSPDRSGWNCLHTRHRPKLKPSRLGVSSHPNPLLKQTYNVLGPFEVWARVLKVNPQGSPLMGLTWSLWPSLFHPHMHVPVTQNKIQIAW